MRRPVLWAALGALAYPLGLVIGHLLFRRSVIYPHKENRRD